MEFDLQLVLDTLKKKRKIFVSEADFQLELAWEIKKAYKNAKVRLEYCPSFNPSLHLDILVIIDNQWYPIELKYKKKGCEKIADGEYFNLKNDGARDIGCYLYLKDIQRIEKIQENVKEFKKGYTIMLTNDLCYTKEPGRDNSAYQAFSLAEGSIKTGTLNWKVGSKTGEAPQVNKPIVLNGSYKMHWQEYSRLDDTNTGTFKYVINEIN